MKENLGKINALYPMPVVVVGSESEGRKNFNTIIDYEKANPFFYDMPGFNYWNLGKLMMRAYTVGKGYKDGEMKTKER